MLEQRTICLIPIPFTDLSSLKKRPVMVISNDFYNKNHEDILVMAITSHVSVNEYSILITQHNMESGELKHESMIRVDKIYSISQNLVIKTFGKIDRNKFDDSIHMLNRLIQVS